MISIFTNTADRVGNALRDFNESNLPTDRIPDMETGEHAVLGKDANLPLIVKELAPVQLEDIKREREKLTKRLSDLDKYEKTLIQLLRALD